MAFIENTQYGCLYMTSDKISARHMFTTRIGGVSRGVFASWNLGVNRGDDDEAVRENYRLAGEIMGCNTDDFVVTKQVHGRIVYLATESDRYTVCSDKRIECDDDVPAAVERYLNGETDGLFEKKINGKTHVDLRGANARRLLQLGLEKDNIDVSDECTMCLPDKYWSHRATDGVRGSMAAAIVL